MTRTNAGYRWSRQVRSGVAGIAVVGAILGASAATAFADPDTTVPTPDPTPSTSVAASAPSKPQALSPSTAASPTVAVAGGAAAGAASPKPVTAAAQGDVLDQLADEYAVGAGGGQLSNLLKMSLKLRAMGFKPSKQYYDEIKAAMEYRPNQNPLISALKDTIAYQQKIRAQMEILQQAQSRQNANSAVMGAGQMPGDSNPGQLGTSMGSAAGGQPAMPAMPAAPVAPAAGSAEAPMP
ncbi:MAG: hypothetical protein KDB71_02290 [Mycobacterium sp.]|nr:hypothetical protein [Mycobacterium sp.]